MATAAELNAQNDAARLSNAAAVNDAAQKGTAVTNNNAAAAAADKMPRYIAMPLNENVDLFNAIKEAAGDKAHGAFILELVAKSLNVALPERKSRSKYATDEEREAAKKEYTRNRQELIKRLMAEHKARLAAEK